MKLMKNLGHKIIALLLVASFMTMFFASCSSSSEDEEQELNVISVVTEEKSVGDSEEETQTLKVEQAVDTSKYIYSQLSEDEQKWYDVLKEAVDNHNDMAIFDEAIEPETLRKLFIAIYNQEESQFWLNSLFYRPTEASNMLALEYRYDEEQVVSMQAEIDEVVEEIFSAFDDTTSDYEKLVYFHDYLVTHCEFSKEGEHSNTIYGTLVDGLAQCEGYAFAYDYLCMLADIDCFVVTGTNSSGATHAWNMVYLDNSWYHVDCTWDDPILTTPNEGFVRHFYMLVRDADIIGLTHIADTTYFSYPLASNTDNYYVREGYSVSSASDAINALTALAKVQVEEGSYDIAVRFTNKDAYNSAVDRLFTLKEIKTVLSAANKYSSSNKVKTNRYVRLLDDDLWIIHISMVYED